MLKIMKNLRKKVTRTVFVSLCACCSCNQVFSMGYIVGDTIYPETFLGAERYKSSFEEFKETLCDQGCADFDEEYIIQSCHEIKNGFSLLLVPISNKEENKFNEMSIFLSGKLWEIRNKINLSNLVLKIKFKSSYKLPIIKIPNVAYYILYPKSGNLEAKRLPGKDDWSPTDNSIIIDVNNENNIIDIHFP